MRIIQISDTHLSRDKPHFHNWAPLAAWIADQHPDLVIHTSDVTFDCAGVEADLSFSAHLMDELGIRWRAVPGNHDVGEITAAVDILGDMVRSLYPGLQGQNRRRCRFGTN